MSKKQQEDFIEYYLQHGNGAKAARLAGYSEANARQQARKLLTKAYIQNIIAERRKELMMETDEVLTRLADHARGSMEDFINAETGQIDIKKAAQNRQLHLLKKLRVTSKHGTGFNEKTVEIELHDAQAALVHLGKHHKLFTDKVQLDWAQELQAAGLDPDEVVEDLTAQFERHLLRDAASVDSGGLPEGEEAG